VIFSVSSQRTDLSSTIRLVFRNVEPADVLNVNKINVDPVSLKNRHEHSLYSPRICKHVVATDNKSIFRRFCALILRHVLRNIIFPPLCIYFAAFLFFLCLLILQLF
jgi:hypothetical protein